MDYDRALFRVYERAIEDIGSTPSIFDSTSSTTTTTVVVDSNGDGGSSINTTTDQTAPILTTTITETTTLNTNNNNNAQGGGGGNNLNHGTTTSNTNTNTTSDNTTSLPEEENDSEEEGLSLNRPQESLVQPSIQQQQQQDQQRGVTLNHSTATTRTVVDSLRNNTPPTPTIVPFTCVFIEITIPQWYNRIKNNICLFNRYRYYQHIDDVSSSVGQQEQGLVSLSLSQQQHYENGTFSNNNNSNGTTNTTEQSQQGIVGSNELVGVGGGGDNNNNNSTVAVTTTTERFRQRALARMHAMRTNTVVQTTTNNSNNNNNEEENSNSNEENGNNNNNDDDNNSTRNDDNNNNNVESSDGESAASNNNNNTTTTNNNNNQNNNNHHHNGGSIICSQKGLYFIMQGCMIFAIWNIFVIIIMHSTYVRPDISNSILGAGLWNPNLSIQKQYHTLHINMPTPPKGYIYDDDNEDNNALVKSNNSSSIVINEDETSTSSSTTGSYSSTNNEDDTMDRKHYNNVRKRNTKKTTLVAPFPSFNTNNNQHTIDFYKGPTCIEYALSSRSPQFVWNETTLTNNTTTNDDVTNASENNNNDTTNTTTTTTLLSTSTATTDNNTNTTTIKTGNWTILPLLKDDEVLYIQIIYNAKKQCSIHGGFYNNNTSIHNQCSRTHVCKSNDTIIVDETNLDGVGFNNTANDNNDTTTATTISKWETYEYWESPMYKFSTMEALMYVSDDFLYEHNISIVNVTLTERCLSMGSDLLYIHPKKITTTAELMTQIYGVMDTVIINQLMYGIRDIDGSYRNGYLQNMFTEERWSWSNEFLNIIDSRDPNIRASLYIPNTIIGTLIVSIFNFFLVTSVTALIVRILTSSGVVLMFPMFTLFRYMGLQGADDRLLGLSYPWIGRAQHIIRRRRIYPSNHLIYAHIGKIILFYSMYEACQGTWSMILYSKSIPAGLPVWIYGFAMIWEYYSMVFVRSALSVHFFPRITLLYYLGYHFYFYTIPYGYFDIALIPLFFLMLHCMIYCILSYEIPSLIRRGTMNIDCPREVYNQISWYDWTSSLPQEWTLFLPLNSRYIPLHDRDIIEPPTTNTTTATTTTTEQTPEAPVTENGNGSNENENNDNGNNDDNINRNTTEQTDETMITTSNSSSLSSSFRQRGTTTTRRTPSNRSIV